MGGWHTFVPEEGSSLHGAMSSGEPWKRCVLVVELGRRWRKGPRTLGQELSRPRRANVIQDERTSHTRQKDREQAGFFAVCQERKKNAKGNRCTRGDWLTQTPHAWRQYYFCTLETMLLVDNICRRRTCQEGR